MAIFGGNSARIYNFERHAEAGPPRDRFADMKAEYERNGPARSNLRYGYIRRAG
ncbi:MAG: hypothetical protein JOZ17_27580 [Acetobacteraceae bacterium]|nr:hypothetical protein [Acetobacteraceae bacterium]